MEILKGFNAKVYLPFLTGSLAHSHQTKANEKVLHFVLAPVFDWAVGMLERSFGLGNQFDQSSLPKGGNRKSGKSPSRNTGQWNNRFKKELVKR